MQSLLTIQIPGDEEQNGEINIYNGNGQLVLTSKINGPQLSLDVSSLSKGIYFAKVSNELGEHSIKFVKK